jgi:AraC family transcriptional regulator
MTKYFERITESNKASLNKPVNADMVYYSELNDWYTDDAFRSFSVKYVIDQCIHYKVDGFENNVKANNYMLACKSDDVKAYFHSKQSVKSVCIDICADTINESFSVLTSREENFDNYLSGYFKTPLFFENINPVHQNAVGNKLQELHKKIEADEVTLTKEWFFDLVEKIIFQEYKNYIALENINSIRPATKKEILKRLHVANEYIKENFLIIENIKEVATHCCMSEYHFFRRFKEVYKTTPLQTITNYKMNLAKELLKHQSLQVTDIASICNYPDVFTFSKAFKRYFKTSPSLFLTCQNN